LGAAVGVVITAYVPKVLSDPDIYSHIALGPWILEHRMVSGTDPLSQTFQGQTSIAFEWLSRVIYAVAHSLGG